MLSLQKIGRMNRPGNVLDTIMTLNYYVRGSYDAWSASIVAIKKKWQEQLLLGGLNSMNGYTRNEEDDSWSMETIMAEIMEDPKEKAIMNFKIKEKTIIGEKESLKERIFKLSQSIDDLIQSIEERRKKIEEYKNNLQEGVKVKLAKMRIKQLTETINKLMEESNQLTSEKENFEIQLKNTEKKLEFHRRSYDEIIAKAKKTSTVSKNTVIDLDEIVNNLKKSNKNVKELTESNHYNSKLTFLNYSFNTGNEKISKKETLQPKFNIFSIEKSKTTEKTFKSKKKITEQFTMNLDALT